MSVLTESSLASFGIWWFTLLICGLLCWPLCAALFPGSIDRGYLASKAAAIVLASYAAWLASAAGFVSFAGAGPLVGLATLAVLPVIFGMQRLPVSPRIFLARELFFTSLLAAGAVIRATSPDIHGLEKFMDFGFMNGAMRAEAMPPPDPWFGGAPINYYYFGHLMAAWVTLVSGVPADHGYNLMMATIFAATASLVFTLVQDALTESGRVTARVTALVASAAVVFGGNFHTVIYGALRPWAGSQTGRDYFFYPDSTRFIGFDPPTDDKAFTEMPAYGFAVADLHGHVSNLPVTMLLLLVMFHAVAQRGAAARAVVPVKPHHVAAAGFLLGAAVMTNAWDAVIYGLVISLLGLAAWLSAERLRISELFRLAGQGLSALAIAILVILPFLIHFRPFGEGVRLVEKTTPLWQWLTLYMHLLPGCLAALAGWALFRQRSAAAAFSAALAAASLTLLILPEIVFLKDIYGADHARANTMFKLTFQGQPLGVIAAALTIGLLLTRAGRRLPQVAALLIAAPLVMPLVYPRYWLWDRLRDVPPARYTLDGLRFVAREAPGEEELIPVIRGLALAPGKRLLEAPGDSYSYAGRFSALTGQPVPLGWRNHEWLWRSDWPKVSRLSGQIEKIYASRSPEEACPPLRALAVQYVVVGRIERQIYPALKEETFRKLGRAIAEKGETRLYEIAGDACGVP
ncbi:DUF2298 domain-containing protein [Aestuariivirga sp.]|uniref:DUF2298 domain-containing protein n=1 Tax=Aestuariivirga sp. TaxID=2650926 RepID=UPI00391D13FF